MKKNDLVHEILNLKGKLIMDSDIKTLVFKFVYYKSGVFKLKTE